MNVFYLARHGETENNRAGRLSGWVDTPLTDKGLVPTEQAIAKLKGVHIDVMCSSDLGRAFVTAYVMARKLGYTDEVIRLPGLREVNYGDIANMKLAEAYKLYPGTDSDTHYTPPNGESLDQMQKRVLETVNMLSNKYQDKTIVLVAHSGVMAALKSSLTGEDFGAYNVSVPYAHEFVARFTVADGKLASFDEVLSAV